MMRRSYQNRCGFGDHDLLVAVTIVFGWTAGAISLIKFFEVEERAALVQVGAFVLAFGPAFVALGIAATGVGRLYRKRAQELAADRKRVVEDEEHRRQTIGRLRGRLATDRWAGRLFGAALAELVVGGALIIRFAAAENEPWWVPVVPLTYFILWMSAARVAGDGEFDENLFSRWRLRRAIRRVERRP